MRPCASSTCPARRLCISSAMGQASAVSRVTVKVGVGDFGRGGPVFRWTAATGPVSMNVPSTGEAASISRNGRYIATNLLDVNTDTSLGAYRWDEAHGWLPTAPAGSCDSNTHVCHRTSTTAVQCTDSSTIVAPTTTRGCGIRAKAASNWLRRSKSPTAHPPIRASIRSRRTVRRSLAGWRIRCRAFGWEWYGIPAFRVSCSPRWASRSTK